jgi:hypothetical protein
MVAMVTRVGYHRDREELEVGMLEDKGKKEWEGPEEESTEGEENEELRNEEVKQETMKEVCTMVFDWATDRSCPQREQLLPYYIPATSSHTTRTHPAAYTPTVSALVTPDPGDEASRPGPDGIALARTALTGPAPINLTPADPILLYNRILTAHVDMFVNTPTVYMIPAHPPCDLSDLKSIGLNTGIPWVGFSHTAPVPVYTITRCG